MCMKTIILLFITQLLLHKNYYYNYYERQFNVKLTLIDIQVTKL